MGQKEGIKIFAWVLEKIQKNKNHIYFSILISFTHLSFNNLLIKTPSRVRSQISGFQTQIFINKIVIGL